MSPKSFRSRTIEPSIGISLLITPPEPFIRSYAWDTTGRQLYVQVGTSVYYEITNPHGDVVALASSNALAGTVHFDAWGNPYPPSGTSIPFGFQGSVGSWTSPITGFVSMGVRWYYPKVGRFLSSDPAAGTADRRTPMAGLRWLYALDNPIRYRDPSGLKVMVDGGGGGCDPCDYTPAPDPVVYQAPAPPPARRSEPSWWQQASNYVGNVWNAAVDVRNIRPDAAGVQDALIAAGNSMDDGWKKRYRNALAESAEWIGNTRADLVNGDPYRVARGVAGVVVFSSNFVPVGGVVTVGRNVLMRGGAALLERAPQLATVARAALSIGREAQGVVRDAVSHAASRITNEVTSGITSAFARIGAREASAEFGAIARGWRVGDPIDALTAAGNSPARSTVRQRYWKNVGNDAVDGEWSSTNMARMQRGVAPQHDKLGVSMELNHITPRYAGGGNNIANLEALWPWEHTAADPFRFYTGLMP